MLTIAVRRLAVLQRPHGTRAKVRFVAVDPQQITAPELDPWEWLRHLRTELHAHFPRLPPRLTAQQRRLIGCALDGRPGVKELLADYHGVQWKLNRAAHDLHERLVALRGGGS